jgi:agmatine deiminase
MTKSSSLANTPARMGYRMPAEWEPHAATWLTWPRKDGISFPDKFEPVPAFWVKMCELLSPGEEVHINAFDEAHEAEILGHLEKARLKVGERVFVHRFPAYEPWCRDHGPIFVINEQRKSHPPMAAVDWGYNAWGNKYPPFDLDDAVPQHVAKLLNIPLFTPGIVMEGGSLDVNGKGTLLTTESCLLNPNRNPGLTKKQIEKYLKDYLGVTAVLWLGDGIVGDDTDGHIDDITRFVDEETVITMIEEDPKDPNHEPLRENYRKLQTMKDQDSNPLRVITIPMPGAIFEGDQRLPASYANFYVGNDVVLLPVFSHYNDKIAVETLQELFPTRKVVPIDCVDLIWGLGAFHCVTQQQPVPPLHATALRKKSAS